MKRLIRKVDFDRRLVYSLRLDTILTIAFETFLAHRRHELRGIILTKTLEKLESIGASFQPLIGTCIN